MFMDRMVCGMKVLLVVKVSSCIEYGHVRHEV
jgi:hypothetical protein